MHLRTSFATTAMMVSISTTPQALRSHDRSQLLALLLTHLSLQAISKQILDPEAKQKKLNHEDGNGCEISETLSFADKMLAWL